MNPIALAVFMVASLASCAAPASPLVTDPLPRRAARPGTTAVGIEYVFIDKAPRIPVEAQALAETGLTAVKHYAEHVEWGEMQSGPRAAIDFTRLDNYVRHYQAAGFGELVLCLKPHARWAAREVALIGIKNPSPKREHHELFATWIRSVVERYDGDGVDDLDGLRWPVRYLEIGSELSSYQPEPIAEYLETLEVAYKAAHAASPSILVAHAAFLTTTAFRDHPTPSETNYERAFADMSPRVNPEHRLASIHAVLDRPELFDVVNYHALADPYELEDACRWLRFEMGQRGYDKPILVSDTLATTFIAWGPATTAKGKPHQLGVIVEPAVEADRERLAAFFTRMVDDDAATHAWARDFIAADAVQRTLIAAEQRVACINLAFNVDLPLLTWKVARAGAGLTAWAGALEWRGNRVTMRHPLFHAITQLMEHLDNYRSVRRIAYADERVRVYEITGNTGGTFCAWLDPQRLLLPGDAVPSKRITLDIAASAADVTAVRTTPTDESKRVATKSGTLELTIGATPVFITPK